MKRGKRKTTTVSSGHVGEQCDVWLTAKPPKKRKVLSREPLHIYNAQTYNEPTLTVPVATKQTTLNDFFRRSRDSKMDMNGLPPRRAHHYHERQEQEQEFDYREFHQVLHQGVSGQENTIPSDVIAVEASTRRMVAKPLYPVTQIVHEGFTRCHQDENAPNESFKENHGNWRPTDTGGEHEDVHDAVGNAKKISGRIPETETGNLPTESDDGATTTKAKRCAGKRNHRCRCKGDHLNSDSTSDNCSVDGRLSLLPYSAIPQSANDTSRGSQPITDRPRRVTFVRLAEVEDSLVSQDTGGETSTGDDQSAFSSECSAQSVEVETQPCLNINMLRYMYIDPELLDTVPVSDSQTVNTDNDQPVPTDSFPESDFSLKIDNPKLVDSELLEANTMEMSTGTGWALSEGDQFMDEPSLTLDQSPLDSLQFTMGTQGCLVLKRLPTDMDDSDEDDSQAYD